MTVYGAMLGIRSSLESEIDRPRTRSDDNKMNWFCCLEK